MSQLFDHHQLLKVSNDMFEKLLDDVDKHSEQLREDLQAPYLSRRFAQATSVQLTLLDITDNEALSPELRERATRLLDRIERRANATPVEPN